jgi:hypothetical protein
LIPVKRRGSDKDVVFPIGDNIIYMLHFVVSQLIIAQDLEDTEYFTRSYWKKYRKWGLEINLSKTHSMCIGQQQSDLLLEGGELIKQFTEYKYLGMKINREATNDSKINERNKFGRYAI